MMIAKVPLSKREMLAGSEGSDIANIPFSAMVCMFVYSVRTPADASCFFFKVRYSTYLKAFYKLAQKGRRFTISEEHIYEDCLCCICS